MKRRGLFRLSVVATAVFVPVLAYWAVNDSMNTWAALDLIAIQTCVNQESTPDFDVDKCVRDAGADKTMFQHENTTPGAFWTRALGGSFLIDLLLTLCLAAVYLAGRWVVRGFRT